MTTPVTPASADVSARIARLFVYPIKSCGGVEVREAVLTDTGLEFDRAWMVVDETGEFVSQRELPRMALIRPTLKHFEMVLRAPGMLALHITLDAVEQPVKARVWDDEVSAYDMGDVAAQWFTDFLKQDLPAGRAPMKLRLVRFDPDFRRLSSLKWTGGVEALNQFSDGFPVLVTSEASVVELNSRLAAAGHAAVTVERFRPNIVLSGLTAHDEDHLEWMRLVTAQGPVELQNVKPCARCPIPNIDPATAASSPAVADALQTYRRDSRLDGAVTFGMNAIVRSGAESVLEVGQAVDGTYRFG